MAESVQADLGAVELRTLEPDVVLLNVRISGGGLIPARAEQDPIKNQSDRVQGKGIDNTKDAEQKKGGKVKQAKTRWIQVP